MAIREDGTIVFEAAEQQELDRIVQERLAREKSKYADYDDIKGIAEELKEFGYEGSPAEIRAAIKAQKEEIRQQKELEKLQQQAEDDGITPALAKKIKDLEDKLEKSYKVIEEITGERTAKQKAEEEQKAQKEDWENQVKEVQEDENLKDIDLDNLASDPKFNKFVKGKSGLRLKELLEDYVDFIGETQAEAIVKVKSRQERSTSSGKGNNPDGKSSLTEAQRKTLEDWNTRNPGMKMTEKEFLGRY